MRTTHLWVMALAPVIAAASVGLTNCSGAPAAGGGDASAGTSSGSGGSSSGNTGSSSGSSSGIVSGSSSGSGSSGGSSSGGSSGSSSGGSGAGDSGADSSSADGGTESGSGGPACVVPEGGAPCDPGTVPCGSTTCSTSTQYCCTVRNGDAGDTNTCNPYNSGSCAAGAVKTACNEAADCSGGECCMQTVGIGVLGPTSCMPSCGPGYIQICRSDTECGGGDSGAPAKCIPQTCTAPAGPGGGGGASVVIEACAVARDGGALMFCTPN